MHFLLIIETFTNIIKTSKERKRVHSTKDFSVKKTESRTRDEAKHK
jgi:hypothetical protein